MKKLLLLFAVLFIVSCEDSYKLDGQLVQDKYGRIYKVMHINNDSYQLEMFPELKGNIADSTWRNK